MDCEFCTSFSLYLKSASYLWWKIELITGKWPSLLYLYLTNLEELALDLKGYLGRSSFLWKNDLIGIYARKWFVVPRFTIPSLPPFYVIFNVIISSCNNSYCKIFHTLFAGSRGSTVCLLVFGLVFLSHISKRLCSHLQRHWVIYSLEVRLI